MAYDRVCEGLEVDVDVAAIAVGAVRALLEAARATAFALGLRIMIAVVCLGRAQLEEWLL